MSRLKSRLSKLEQAVPPPKPKTIPINYSMLSEQTRHEFCSAPRKNDGKLDFSQMSTEALREFLDVHRDAFEQTE